MRILLRASGVGEIVVGLALLIGSQSALEVVTAEVWEIELLRYLGLFIVALGLQLGWDARRGNSVSAAVARHVAGAWILLVIYVFSSSGLFLILGFSLLMASTVEVGLARALAYSEAVRRQLDLPVQRRR